MKNRFLMQLALVVSCSVLLASKGNEVSAAELTEEIAVEETGDVEDSTEKSDLIGAGINDGDIEPEMVTVEYSSDFQSAHYSQGECHQLFTYTYPYTEYITIKFSDKTEVKENDDYITVIDGEGNIISRCTGKELAGKEVSVDGNKISVSIDSGNLGEYYGFSISGIHTSEFFYSDIPDYLKIEYSTGTLLKCLTDIEEVTIPENVSTLSADAFNDNTNLKRVTLPSSLRKIEGFSYEKDNKVYFKGSFSGCTNLEEIRLPENMQIVECGAFSGCNLKRLYIPGEGTILGDYTLKACNPYIITPIGSVAYWDATYNGYHVVQNDADIPSKENEDTPVEEKEDNFIIIDGVLKQYKGNDDNVVIPEGVIEIGAAAFRNNKTIKSVTIPNTVKKIGAQAFMDCIYLSKVNMPETLDSIGYSAFLHCRFSEITIPEGVKTIGDVTFAENFDLKKIVFPSSLEEIERDAFACDGIEELVIPKTVKTIGTWAFSRNSLLKKVQIEEGVEKIEKYAFYKCRAKCEIYIPKSVKRISSTAFEGTWPILYVPSGSYAESYCKKNNIDYNVWNEQEVAVPAIDITDPAFDSSKYTEAEKEAFIEYYVREWKNSLTQEEKEYVREVYENNTDEVKSQAEELLTKLDMSWEKAIEIAIRVFNE